MSIKYFFSFFIAFFSALALADTNLTLLHTNDLHSHLFPLDENGQDCSLEDKCLGGFARLKSLIDEERQKDPDLLLLDAGDRFSGTFFYTFHKEKDLIPLFQNLNYNAFTLGNHEFDDRLEVLENFLEDVKTPCITTNVKFQNSPLLNSKIKTSFILERGNQKIAILGVLTKDVATLAMHGKKITVLDPKSSIQTEIQYLKEKGINIFILLSHLGLEEDKNLAHQIHDLDIIVSGHSHNLLSNDPHISADGPYPINISHQDQKTKTLIVTTGAFGRFLGKITLKFDRNGDIITYQGDTIPLTNLIKNDPKISEFITNRSLEIDHILNEKIQTLEIDLPLTPDQSYCSDDCLVGSALAQMIYEGIPTCDVTLINSGAIRSGFSKGSILRKNIIQALPFDGTAVLTKMSGEKLKKYLEIGLQNYKSKKRTNNLLQIGGGSYQFNPETHKIISLNINGKEVEDKKIYRIVIPLFLAEGGDHFPIQTNYQILPKTLTEIIEERLKKGNLSNFTFNTTKTE